MMYFKNCGTLEELKKQYRRLAMKYHPDCGGSTGIMQAINAEHDALFETLKKQHNASADEYHQTTETAAEFRDIIEALLKFGEIVVELCGSWVWVSGNTKPWASVGARIKSNGIGTTRSRAGSGDGGTPAWKKSAGSMAAKFLTVAGRNSRRSEPRFNIGPGR